METMRQKDEGLKTTEQSQNHVASTAHSGSWRERPQRAFISKSPNVSHASFSDNTQSLLIPGQAAPHQPSRRVHTYKCVQLQVHAGWNSSLALFYFLLPPDAHHASPVVRAVRASVTLPFWGITEHFTPLGLVSELLSQLACSSVWSGARGDEEMGQTRGEAGTSLLLQS